MIAFDTSVVIRIATGDNPKQKAAALALLDKHEVLIPKSVIFGNRMGTPLTL